MARDLEYVKRKEVEQAINEVLENEDEKVATLNDLAEAVRNKLKIDERRAKKANFTGYVKKIIDDDESFGVIV